MDGADPTQQPYGKVKGLPQSGPANKQALQ